MHGNVVSDHVIHIFSYTTTAISLVVNGLLIFTLLVTKLHHVGPYRWLLITFAAFDICISLSHSITLPAIHMTEFGVIIWSLRFSKMPTAFGVWSLVVWIFLFYQTFILLAYHYVYRFVYLCNPPWLLWIRRSPWRIWISIALVSNIFCSGTFVAIIHAWFAPTQTTRRIFAPVMREVYNIDLFAENRPGFMAIMFWVSRSMWTRVRNTLPGENGAKDWQMSPILAAVVDSNFIFVSVAVIVFCIKRIVAETSAANDNLESKTRRMQRQLFQALLWQTIVPGITSFIPVFLIVIIPLALDIPLGGMGTVALMSIEIFPMIDPFLIFIFVPRYRSALRGVACHCCKNSLSTANSDDSVQHIKISTAKSTETQQNSRAAIVPFSIAFDT